ncbi:hypothetical protein JYU34_014452 [Plutella xylostella]|uniref:Uncharacterized protein n=1 Tax=Plutella xylostella TaxID=51655 RepID=A0ABQ7Q8F9_PLUXY|nr:hypothetical protein JYU34_014452 [Plutella xylostella]
MKESLNGSAGGVRPSTCVRPRRSELSSCSRSTSSATPPSALSGAADVEMDSPNVQLTPPGIFNVEMDSPHV